MRRWFVGSFVGLNVGKSRLPDSDWSRRINELRGICRVCRVSVGVESCWVEGKIAPTALLALKVLIRLDLIDACD